MLKDQTQTTNKTSLNNVMIKDMALPKVLIIGQPFNNDTGGGITLSNLFRGWDRERLAVACLGYLLLDNIDTEVCDTYYQLGYKEHKWRFPFRLLQRKYKSGLIRFDSKRIQNLTISKSRLRVKMIMNYFYPLLEFLGLYHYLNKTDLSSEFSSWLLDFNPDLIYAQTATRDGILFCIKVHSFLEKPLVFHMMDDWPSTISKKGLLRRFWHKKIDREFRQLLDRATMLMGISEEMANEYKRRYNKTFLTFHNTIDMGFWKKNQRSRYEINGSPTLLYAGRIGMGIDSSLELIAKAVQRVNNEAGISIRFILQTQGKPEWMNQYNCVSHKGFVPYDLLPRVFAEADFLLLPYDFSPESIKYIKYSMPTKAPEYMVSGTPIIIFAPHDTATVKYATRYNWAKIITENDLEAVAAGIRQLVENKELRASIARNAVSIAEKNHNSINVTSEFQNAISSLAEKGYRSSSN
jgi:glycosyltransferase involved in cell wall biosynthesis